MPLSALPTTTEKRGLDTALINGTAADRLTTTGDQTVTASFVTEDARFLSSLVAYEIAADGTLQNAKVVFEVVDGPDRGGGPLSGGETVEVGTYADGTQLGLALLQDAGSKGIDLADGTLEFRAADGSPANIADAMAPSLYLVRADGSETAIEVPIFHTADADPADPLANSLNPAGAEHTVSAVDADGNVVIAFEDVVSTAKNFDGDYNDAVFKIAFGSADGDGEPMPPLADLSGDNLVVTPSGGVQKVDLRSGEVEELFEAPVAWTDVDVTPEGRVFGISFSDFYEIDLEQQTATLVGSHGVAGLNALEVGDDGTIYAASNSQPKLFSIDPVTGAATEIGDLPPGVFSAGDLQFVNGKLYLAGNSELVVIDPENGFASSVIGEFGSDIDSIFGITTDAAGEPVGLSGSGNIYSIDVNTGDASFVVATNPLTNINGAAAFVDEMLPDSTQTVESDPVTLPDGQEVAVAIETEAETSDDTAELSGVLSLTGFLASNFNIAFVNDASGSTGATARDAAGQTIDLNGDGIADSVFAAQVAAFQELAQQINGAGLGDSDLGIVSFGSRGSLDVVTKVSETGVIETTLNNPGAGGSTNFTDGLQKAIDFFAAQPDVDTASNIVYFLSDGQPNTGGDFRPNVATLGDPDGIGALINAFGAGTGAREDTLDLVDNTGGAEIFTDLSELAAGLTGSSLSIDDILSVDINVNGVTQATLDETAFSNTATGLQFGPVTLTGLDPTAINTLSIEAVLETDDGQMFDLVVQTEIVGTAAPAPASTSAPTSLDGLMSEPEPIVA